MTKVFTIDYRCKECKVLNTFMFWRERLIGFDDKYVQCSNGHFIGTGAQILKVVK